MATFNGTPGNDFQKTGWSVLYGNGGDDYLASDQPGADSIDGGAGSDFLFVWANNAAVGNISGGDGNDTVFGHLLGDNLSGGTGNDLIVGSDFSFNPGNPAGVVNQYDQVSGNDILDGGAGTDALYGLDGKDVIRGGDGDDNSSVINVPGNDFYSSGHTYTVYAGLFGGDGGDTIYGGKGSDHLYGGWGSDTLRGDSGADLFVFGFSAETPNGSRRDVIKDFSHGQHDGIDLYWIDAKVHQTGNQAFKFIGDHGFHDKAGELRFHHHIVSGDTDGDGKADFEIKVAGVNTLHANDFFL